jgi:hypothetical protein
MYTKFNIVQQYKKIKGDIYCNMDEIWNIMLGERSLIPKVTHWLIQVVLDDKAMEIDNILVFSKGQGIKEIGCDY